MNFRKFKKIKNKLKRWGKILKSRESDKNLKIRIVTTIEKSVTLKKKQESKGKNEESEINKKKLRLKKTIRENI